MAGLIYKKMSDVMKDVGAIGKDQKNAAQGFKFRGIDQFVNALYPALTKHGVFMTTEVLEATQDLKEVERSSGKKGVDKHVALKMKYTFHAEDGSSVSSSIPSEGLDSGDKATNKALSAALKYALIQTFSIPTEDMEEADKDSPTIGSPAKTSLKPVTLNGGLTFTQPAIIKPENPQVGTLVTSSSVGPATPPATTLAPEVKVPEVTPEKPKKGFAAYKKVSF